MPRAVFHLLRQLRTIPQRLARLHLRNAARAIVALRQPLQRIGLPGVAGLALGIYTGILLSAMVARPLWNSAVLGPLFLFSGLFLIGPTLMLAYRSLEGLEALAARSALAAASHLLDPDSEIRYIIEHKRVMVLKEELNTMPKFFYFYGT